MNCNSPCKNVLLCVALLFFPFYNAPASGQEAVAPESAVFGIWENSSRFLEISPEGQMRLVLKPYYAFVYEDAGWIPCAVSEEGDLGAEGVYALSLSYPAQRVPQVLPVAVIGGDSLCTAFYTREEGAAAAVSGEGGISAEDAMPDLSGFWVGNGDSEGIRLYGKPPAEEFFCLYFAGGRYYKIRYWLTDARFRDARAVFGDEGSGLEESLSVPKFLRRGDFLYTCVTGTGTVLRSYEQGSWELSEGFISFYADSIMFKESLQSETVLARFSADGAVMALGLPQFVRSEVNNMDAAIAERNSMRRPPRKPPLELMELDFRWDEIEKLRQ